MALAISGTPSPDFAFVSLSVSGLTGYDAVAIQRTNPDGSQVIIRNANYVLTGGADTFACSDIEAPLGAAVTYTAIGAMYTTRNLVLNPSLTTDLSNTQDYSSVTRAWINTDGKYGPSCVQHTNTATALAGTTWTIPTVTGITGAFQVSCWVKLPASGPTTLNLICRSGTTTVKSAAITPLPPAGTWTRVTTSFSLVSTDTIDRIGVSSNATSGTVWWADAAMAEVSPITHNYGDGSFSGWSWDGTSDASASRTSVTTTAQATSSPITISVAAGTGWLKNITQPALNTEVSVESVQDVKRPTRSQTYTVIGRKNPVVVSDVRGGRQGSLTLMTTNSTDLQSVRALLAPGSVLFFQATPADGFDDLYFAAGDVTEKRPAGVSTDPTRLWQIDFIEVDSPSGAANGLPNNSYTQVVSFGTYQAVLTNRSTYLDVLNTPYGSGPGGI